jgi:hypothetical protein
LHPKIGETDI